MCSVTRRKIYNVSMYLLRKIYHICAYSYIFCNIISSETSSSSFTGVYNPLAGFSLLIPEVSRSHTLTHHSW
jgi:hypothetical protein